MSPVMGMPSPASVQIQSQQSNLQQLCEARPVVMPVPLQRGEYPGARFWERPLWTEWVVKEREKGGFDPGIKGRGVNSSFMEDSDGNRVHPNRQTRILEEAHSCWRTMQSFNINLMPYREMPATVMEYFHKWMESECPELQLCASHWKADQIWRENFSSSKVNGTTTKKSNQVSEAQKAAGELHQSGPAKLPDGRRNL